MNVIFKDVGQGDSIILEWMDEGAEKLGIIDCNLKSKKNPVVEHLRKNKTKEIEFIILSHPHRDHFSGMLSLLRYIKHNGISVKQFAHTLNGVGTQYWRWFEHDTKDIKKLATTISLMRDLYSTKTIAKIKPLVEDVRIELTKSIYFRCLSPSHAEFEKYQEIVNLDPAKHPTRASSAANFLATVLKLNVDNKYILFTSDAEAKALERITNEISLEGKKFQICQIPHHGSYHNHYPVFWETIEVADERNFVISTGLHKKFKHPDYTTIKWFFDKGYKIHATNIVYGMKDLVESIAKKNLILDQTSMVVADNYSGGDKIFTIKT